MLNLEYFEAGGSPVGADGVFIPAADLLGVDAAELAAAVAGKEGKVALSLMNVLYDTLSDPTFDSLGWSVSKGNPTSAGPDLINQQFSASVTFVANHGTNSLQQLPVPTAGANLEVGKFGIADLFPSAAKLSSGNTAPGAGVLIPTTELGGYGAPAHAAITIAADADNRSWVAALLQYLTGEVTVRSAEDASAVTAVSVGSATGLTPVSAWTAATDPLTGLDAADLPKLSFFSKGYSATFQLLLDQNTQTFDVNHVTT